MSNLYQTNKLKIMKDNHKDELSSVERRHSS